MKSRINRILSLILALCLAVLCAGALAACTTTVGQLAFKDLTVNTSTVKTVYTVGDEVDFSGIKVRVRYNDNAQSFMAEFSELSFELDGMDITNNLNAITETAGEKEVVVKFFDNLAALDWQTVVLKITVKEDVPVVPVEVSEGTVTLFEAPRTIQSYRSTSNVTAAYGDAAFEGQFSVGGKIYRVGSQNPFYFLPSYIVEDEEGEQIEGAVLPLSVSLTDVAAENELAATEVDETTVAFYDGEDLIVTVDIVTGAYQFTSAADGKEYLVSVLPSEDYEYEGAAVSLQFTVVDAYNIYKAEELCLIDNADGHNHKWSEDGYVDWANYKLAKGYDGITVRNVVFQQNITLKATDVPEDFFASSVAPITITENEEETIIPAGTRFLFDGSDIYTRFLSAGEEFHIWGNYFKLDVQDFPTVASTGMKDSFAYDVTYGGDCSNAQLFRIKGQIAEGDAKETYTNSFSLEDLSLIGNANRNEKIDGEDHLVSAGGLIMIKNRSNVLTVDNVVTKCFFISFLVEDGLTFTNGDNSSTETNVLNTKVFDSFQNAAFVWGECTMNVRNSYMQRAGGPLFILQHVDPSDNTVRQPALHTTDCVLESYVNGSELWFKTVAADALAGQIKNLSGILSHPKYGFGSYVTNETNAKMNMIVLLMSNGSNATETVGAFNTQGVATVTANGKTAILDRRTDSALGGAIYANATGIAAQTGNVAPFFNVGSDEQTGAASLVYSDGVEYLLQPGEYFYGNPVPVEGISAYGIPSELEDYLAAYAAADYVALNYGGFGLLFAFTHEAE